MSAGWARISGPLFISNLLSKRGEGLSDNELSSSDDGYLCLLVLIIVVSF